MAAVKKSKALSRKSGAKSTQPAQTVDEYLARLPEPARTTLGKIRATIRSIVPPETAEVISYRIPAFKYKGVLVWYAAFSDHCSLFPTNAVIEACKDDLKNYTLSKGTIQFPVDKPLPVTLLKKMMRMRLAQVSQTGK
jgi:uncharacterized protein YdhG (YjbR/CyaY superfamily)